MVNADISWRPAPAALPPGLRVYAIGDVHGHDARLEALHHRIVRHLAAAPVPRVAVVHLGDLVDRGPDSATAVERVRLMMRGQGALPEAEVVCLLGNHEAMMVASLQPGAGGVEAAEQWLANGAEATLRSYGVRVRPAAAGARPWASAVPGVHQAFLAGLPRLWRAGGYAFVHAGLRPGLALEAQDPEDLIWIREPFLSQPGPLPAVAVHGHTPVREPEVLAHRIGIDTGAGLGGPLTAAVLEGGWVGFLQV